MRKSIIKTIFSDDKGNWSSTRLVMAAVFGWVICMSTYLFLNDKFTDSAGVFFLGLASIVGTQKVSQKHIEEKFNRDKYSEDYNE